MFSFVGETVLDPFLGSGTTALAAKNLNRNSIGYEINDEFISVIEQKLNLQEKDFFDEADVSIITNKNSHADFDKDIQKLPYVFKDAVNFDKKVNPKKLLFGSKVDKRKQKREDYYRVKRVLSPNKLLLNNDLKIKLLGVAETPETRQEAINFLEEKTKGRNVYMKFDSPKYDGNNCLLCYLYLQNKTFLNSHLIKKHLVDVDTSLEYQHQSKFLRERVSV